MEKVRSGQKIKRRRVTFSLSAAGAAEVALVADFNGWNDKSHPMKNDGNGEWKKIVMLSPGQYEYKFIVDGRWQTDPANQDVRPNCFGTYNHFLRVTAA